MKVDDVTKMINKKRNHWVGRKHTEETKVKMSLSQKGRKHTEITKEKMRIAAMGNKNGFKKGHKVWCKGKGHLFLNENNPNWMGDDAKYGSIHSWVVRHFGKPKKCEWCDSVENLDWSNKDHQYVRKRSDWHVLCKKCHRKYDKNNRIEK